MRRRLLLAAVAWVAAVAVGRGVVALPERCPAVTPADMRASAAEAVAWFERNQLPDGRWVYRYDRADDVVDRGLQQVRHAGVTMSLYQAYAAGLEGALRLADDGAAWATERLLRRDGWAAVAPGGNIRTGATALLVAGLATRQHVSDDATNARLLGDLSAFLVEMIEPSGAVIDEWDVEREAPIAGSHSPFATGEVAYALAWMATLEPEARWADEAARVLRYLATRRDRAEDRFPPVSDHWAALALDQLDRAGVALDRPLLDYGHRLAGLFGLQVRYESQRTDEGANRWVQRGPRALGAAIGTLGEGMAALLRLAERDDGFRPPVGRMRDRLECNAGLLVDRQVDDLAAASAPQPDRAQGAWFRFDVTQQDDQQHSLSALLASAEVLEEGGGRGGPSGDDGAARVAWLAVIAVAAVNPARVRRLAPELPASAFARGAVAVGAVLAVAVLLAGPVLRAIDVSPPTALVAAGFVTAASALVDLVRRPLEPAALSGVPAGALPGGLRPAATFTVLAIAGDSGVVPGLVAVAAIASALVVIGRTRYDASSGAALQRAVAALAVAGAVDLTVHGVLGV